MSLSDHPLIRQMREFFEAVFGMSRPAEASSSGGIRRRVLPFDICVTIANTSFPIHPAGPLDELDFFQRSGVPDGHEFEFLSRIDPWDRLAEDYQPFGLFRLRCGEAIPLIDTEAILEVYQVLKREFGLPRVPPVTAMNPEEFTSFDLSLGNLEDGYNLLDPPEQASMVCKGRRRISYPEVLTILRRVMSGPVKVAWFEEAFRTAPPRGEIVHRYYFSSPQEVYLVRHHWRLGKLLYRADTSEEARRIFLATGVYKRPARRKRVG